MWRKLCAAIYVVQYMRCKLCGAICVVQFMWGNLCGAIHLWELKSSSPVLVQTSRPPTRNLFGKTHDADGGGTTDNGTDDGARDASDDVDESATEMRA